MKFKLTPSRILMAALLLALGAFSFFIPLPRAFSKASVAPTPSVSQPSFEDAFFAFQRETATAVTRSAALKEAEETTVVTIATGADSGFFSGLTNLVGSIRVWCPECHIAVFNLGLDANQIKQVKGWCNVSLEWEEGMPKVDGKVLAPKQYAWKPMAILHAVITFKVAMWLDAGCSLSGYVMPTLGKILLETGHFTVQGQDTDSSRWCHIDTLRAFGKEKSDMENKPSFAGGVVGFRYGSPAYYDILLPWVHCAGRSSCIAPSGSSLADHRFDQCVLSILSHHAKVNVTPHTELLAYTNSQLKPCYQPSEMIIWTARQGESCYASKANVACASS